MNVGKFESTKEHINRIHFNFRSDIITAVCFTELWVAGRKRIAYPAQTACLPASQLAF